MDVDDVAQVVVEIVPLLFLWVKNTLVLKWNIWRIGIQ